MIRSGTADLPLHYGKVPEWLAGRMAELGRYITEMVLAEFGMSGWIARMSDPFWFQAMGCVLGMDWHSSGITTSVMGALKRSLNPLSRELGIHICGGRGRYSRNTPGELVNISQVFGTPGEELATASRLSAKIDNSCLQDGFQIYLHTFCLCRSGEWAVIQQGMNKETGTARRYHWHSRTAGNFVDDPHTAIIGEPGRPASGNTIVNFSDSRSAAARDAVLDFTHQHPEIQQKELKALGLAPGESSLSKAVQSTQPELFPMDMLVMPAHHDVRPEDVKKDRLGAVLAAAYDRRFSSFTDTLLMNGIGPRTMQALALVSEVVYGKPNRFSDPARFSFAHGGKDGHPFPVPLTVYDSTISFMEKAVEKAKIGLNERRDSLRRLHRLTREIEDTLAPIADVDAVIRKERISAPLYGGKTVFGDWSPKWK